MIQPRAFLGYLAALLVLISHNLFAHELTLPELGSPNRAIFDQQQEEVLSLAFLEAIYQQADLVTDPELNQYIRSIAHRLLRHTHSNRHFQFYIINDNNINAFAGPGGIIAVNTGLILAAKSEDEIAAVLAHEIQHVQQEHISRMFANHKKSMLTTLGTIVGALLIGSQNPEAGAGILMSGMAYSIQEQLAFSRDNEWEADRTGIELLAAAGYDPNAMADFFSTLAKRHQNDSNIPEMLLTHPVSSKRLADSRARAGQLTSKKLTLLNKETLQLAKIRIAFLQGKDRDLDGLSAAEQCYLQSIRHNLLNRQSTPPCSSTELPSHIWSHLARLSQQKNNNNQINDWKSLIELYPNDISVQLRYADHLLEQQQAMQLIQQLDGKVTQFSEQYELWRRLAQAWHQLKNETEEAYHMARAYASIGAISLAEIQLNRANQSLKNNDLKTKNKIASLKEWLDLQQKLREK